MKKILLVAGVLLCSVTVMYAQGIYKMWGITQFGGSKTGTLFSVDANGNNYSDNYIFDLKNSGANPKYTQLSYYNGKLYGVTSIGGENNAGVIFEWDPISNIYTKKFDFSKDSGIQPAASLTLFNNKFYGMASAGGVYNMGVIFEWDPATNVYSKKIDFNGLQGRNPESNLYELNGNFYGVISGGAYNRGILFEWDPALNIFSKKYDFENVNESYPNGDLTIYNGKLYGTSLGVNSGGVIFEFDPASNLLNNKFYFIKNNGEKPNGKLTFRNGKLYGSTGDGGNNDAGVIFEWDPSTNVYSKKFDFPADMPDPYYTYNRSDLIIIDDNFYGTTRFTNYEGYMFSWNSTSNVYRQVFHFGEANGSQPLGGLTVLNGKIYGMTMEGGADIVGGGLIFEYDPKSNVYTRKIVFNLPDVNGSNPVGSIANYNGKLYGFTKAGGMGYGVLFEWNPSLKSYTKKIDFDGLNSNYNTNSLSLWKNKFYGITNDLQSNSLIFEWNPETNIYNKKISINKSDGFNSFGSLTLFQDKFYGMTREGGENQGVIFEYNPQTNLFTKKINLSSTSGNAPVADLVLYQNKFYGTTLSGGKNNGGTIFEWDPATNILIKKFDFDSPYYPYGQGHISYGSLTLFNNKFYGTTSQGGKYDRGVIFEWDPSTNIYTNRFDFSSLTGDYPDVTLITSNNRLFGFTHWDGGKENGGAIFEWDPVSNIFSKKHDFDSYWGISNILGLKLTSAPAPVSSGLANSCITFPSITIDATNNNQWVSIIDDENNAFAEIKANGNNLGNVTASMFINGGAIRKDKNNQFYLDRSITISPQVQPKTPVDVRLYIKAAEYKALKTAANTNGQSAAIDSITDVKIYTANVKCSASVPALNDAVATTAENWEGDYVLSAKVSSLSSFFFAAAKTTCAPPVISNMLISTDTLWPPLHSLRGISVAYKTSGDCKCDPVTRWLTVKSNEPISGTGSADKSPDWIIKDANHVYLRAERSDRGTGRIYTITINAKNTAGAVSTYDFTVAVPLTMPAAKAAAIAAKQLQEKEVPEQLFNCSILPNPSAGYFNLQVETASAEKIEVRVIDMSGALIKSLTASNHQPLRFGNDLKPGVYMIKVVRGQQQQIIKVIKQ